MEGVGSDQISYITDVAVFELTFTGLQSERTSMDGDYSAETKLLITELLRRVEVILAFFGEDLHP